MSFIKSSSSQGEQPAPTLSASSLRNLLAPFNSVPAGPSAPSSTHTHSTQPPTAEDISSELHPTAGPDSDPSKPSAKLAPLPVVPPSLAGRSLAPSSTNQTVRNAWQYLPFFTKQATNIASSFVSHHLKGPPKKSWGIEMTIFTAIVRDMANFTHLSSIHQLRSLMDLGQILPMPQDGIITPVSFKVKRHGLTGFLQELDRSEDGSRVLTGEWVLSKKTWKRMQSESLARRSKNQDQNRDYGFGENPPQSQTPPVPNHQHGLHGLGQDKVIYFIHGGAYFIMSASTHRPLTISIAKYTECRLFAINYRLAPETKFPGPLHDVVAGYFRLLNDLSIPPQNIVLAGDSAGGGLATALLMYLRDEKYPLPSAAMLFSPWCDLTMSCDSWPYDFLPMPKHDDALNPVRCYLGEEGINKWITHPYVSPLFGDMHGLPPLLIQAGDAEVLRDEITLLAHKASLHGVKVIHEIYEDCVHVFQAFLFLESSTKALQSMRNFIRHVIPKMERQLDLASDMETTYRPRPSSPGSYDRQSIDASDPNQGAVDREISRDAHLVDEMSQTVKQSLPPTPAVPNLDGSEDQDNSDSEEVLSASDDGDDEDVTLASLPDRAEPFRATTLNESNGSVSETLTAPNLPQSPSNASLSRQENRSSTLSLRGRLPPAMDLETIKNLFMSTPRHDAPSDLVDEPSHMNMKDDLATKSPQSNFTPARRTSLQTSMIPIHSGNGSIQSYSGSQSPVDSRHARRHSGNQHALRPSHSRKFTTSNVALLTPMVRNQEKRGSTSSNVNEDVQAMVQNLISTPSQLKTTVYSQGEEDDPDLEYFKGIHSHSRRGTSITTPSSLDDLPPLSQPVSSGRDQDSSSPSETSLSKLSLDHDLIDDAPDSPEFAFQTPGYGFS